MKHRVGVGDMKISDNPGDLIYTQPLGSCLGIAVHDPKTGTGGICHLKLPSSKVSPEEARKNPYLFVDSGTPLFFSSLFRHGVSRKDLVIKVAGGAGMGDEAKDFFAIGRRNILMLRKLFCKNGIKIAGGDVGGTVARTLYLEVGSGKTWTQHSGRERVL